MDDDHAVAARSPFTGPGDALLDQPAAEIGVDQARSVRAIASSRLLSGIRSRRANRASHFVLKTRKAHLFLVL
jgi:hypothetical protein